MLFGERIEKSIECLFNVIKEVNIHFSCLNLTIRPLWFHEMYLFSLFYSGNLIMLFKNVNLSKYIKIDFIIINKSK